MAITSSHPRLPHLHWCITTDGATPSSGADSDSGRYRCAILRPVTSADPRSHRRVRRRGTTTNLVREAGEIRRRSPTLLMIQREVLATLEPIKKLLIPKASLLLGDT